MTMLRKRKKVDVNLIPFINVIFLLLIFFMVAGRVEPLDVLDVDVPLSESKDSLSKESVTIFINREGKVVVNRDFVEMDTLPTVMKTLFMQDHKYVVVKVDANSSVGHLIDIMDVLREAGGEEVVIETQSIIE